MSTRGGHKGLPLDEFYPKGMPKRTTPMRDHPKHPALAPSPSGFFVAKYSLGWPFHPPLEWPWYRAPVAFTTCLIIYDLAFGFPVWSSKEQKPGTSAHSWFGNDAGVPHHFWCYQDGWHVPNHSGVKRIYE